MNVHPDCQDHASRCQPKGSRLLLRRQRSASEIDASGALGAARTQTMQEQDQTEDGGGGGGGSE